jgi:hypothetical protein
VSDKLPEGCKLEWHYWDTGHGKGPHDGVGACLKQMLRKEQLKVDGYKLQNARDVVSFLDSIQSSAGDSSSVTMRKDVHRVYREIGKTEVDKMKRVFNCKTIPGSRSMHSVRSMSHSNPKLIECCDYSCFCIFCMFGEGTTCPNRSHVGNWNLVTIEPCDAGDAREEPEEEDPDWEQ